MDLGGEREGKENVGFEGNTRPSIKTPTPIPQLMLFVADDHAQVDGCWTISRPQQQKLKR